MSSPTKRDLNRDRKFAGLIRDLNSEYAVERHAAADSVLALPQDEIAELLKYNTALADAGASWIQIVVMILFSVILTFALIAQVWQFVALLAFLGLIVQLSLTLLYLKATARHRLRQCEGLAQVIQPNVHHLDGVTGVPVAADAVFSKDRSTSALARAILIRQLPRLTPVHTALLVPSQQRRLSEFLLGDDTELIVAILKAYGQIGDASVLKNVVWLTQVAPREPVRQVASECLLLLQGRIAEAEERQARVQVGKTLLRASAAEQTASDTLLRAAAETQETASEQLLRAETRA